MGLMITKNIKQQNVYIQQQQNNLMNGGNNMSHSFNVSTHINGSSQQLIFNNNGIHWDWVNNKKKDEEIWIF